MTASGQGEGGREASAYDEMVDGRGGVRAHWRSLLATFHGLGERGLQERAAQLDRLLEEEGLGAVLPGGGRETSPWRCDPVPLLLQPNEFATLEAGLAQRARVISAALDDLYAGQSLLRDGIVPAAPVFASPGFLRPCRDTADAGADAAPGRHLSLYAADLIRDENGSWRVLADRTSVVSGMGIARENRQVLSRVLPEAFRAVQVRHQRTFFDRWRDAMAGADHPTATVALLTPGTSDPHWLEHVVLARELSCTLVEGGDLAVRGGTLSLKTLQGLQPVHVLLRQVEGRLLDPLELDVAASRGMPGLLDAARSGGVAILNGPGSGLGEAPVIAACLPEIARTLLGETLKLPALACLWLGEPADWARVATAPEGWILRRAADEAAAPVILARLDPDMRAARLATIRETAAEWVAVERVAVGTAPCVGTAQLSARPVVVRMFLVFDGTSWRAMRGGLGRVCDQEEGFSAACRAVL